MVAVKRQQMTPRKTNLAIRDGKECWFCGVILPKDQLTVEHLLSLTDGGNNNPKNLVLACRADNKIVSTWSIARKVAYRDRKRQEIHVRTA